MGQCIQYPYGVMAQPFTRSTAARKRLYLRDVSLRPKTDQNTVSSSFFFMLRKQRERIVHPTSFDEFLTEIKQQLI